MVTKALMSTLFADRKKPSPQRFPLMLDGHPRCPLCASADTRVYMDGENQRLTLAAMGSSRTDVSSGRILQCLSCNLGFRQMRPNEEELSQLYCELDRGVYESESEGRSKTAMRHLKILQRYRSSGRLLDVGCASGMFLRCAADAGWEVVGVEPSQTFCNSAREVLRGRGEVICATLKDARLSVASFDAVTLWDVLEHVPDPAQLMRTCGC